MRNEIFYYNFHHFDTRNLGISVRDALLEILIIILCSAQKDLSQIKYIPDTLLL